MYAIATRACSNAARPGVCFAHSCSTEARWLRRRWQSLNKHKQSYCRARKLFALPRLVFVWPYGACARSRCVGAAALLGGAYGVCTAAAGFAGMPRMTVLAIAEISTTEAIAARASCLLCRGLFSCGPAMFVHDHDAWLQRRCPAGCALCALLLLDSQMWWRCQEPNFKSLAQSRLLPRARAFGCIVACFRAWLRCMYAIATHARCSARRVLCAQHLLHHMRALAASCERRRRQLLETKCRSLICNKALSDKLIQEHTHRVSSEQ